MTSPRPSLTIFKETSILDNVSLNEMVDRQVLYSIINSDILKTKWDIAVYSQMYASQLYSNEKSQLEKYYNNFIENTNNVRVKYVRAKHGFGRVYPQHSLGLTSISKKIRDELIKNTYFDYDLKNAQPSILQNICNEHNIQCPKLDEYCNNRESYLQKIVSESGGLITRDYAKKLMLRLFFNGTFSGFIKDFNIPNSVSEPDCVSVFIHELNTICQIIKKHNKILYDTVRKNKIAKSSTHNIDGAFLSLFIQDQELRIVGAIVQWLIKSVANNNILTYEYDGIKILKTDVSAYTSANNNTCFKTILNQKTYEMTGFKCEWELKEIVGFNSGEYIIIPLPLSKSELKTSNQLNKESDRIEKKRLKDEELKNDSALKKEKKEVDIVNKKQESLNDYNKELEELKKQHDDINNPYCFGVIKNDQEGANVIIEKIKHKLKYCNDEVYMKNEMVWSRDNDAVDKMLMDYILHCDLRKSPTVGIFFPYSKNVKGARDLKTAVLAILQRVNTDNKLYDKFHTTTKGRLCFKDGVLDITTKKFTPIIDDELPESFGEYFTTIQIDRNFGDYYNTGGDTAIINKIRDDIIKPLFGNNWERVMTYWARAMFGHYEDKSWMLYTGNRNCGKGVINDLNESAFGRYHANINSDNFITKSNRQAECEKELQFAIPAQFSRWAFCQEQPDVIDKRARINSSLIKSLVSGGDKQRAKVNYAIKSVQFLFAPTLVMMCNDHSEFTQNDVLETCNEITSVVQFISEQDYNDKVARGDKMIERYRIRDTHIKDLCKTSEYSNAWIMLCLQHYKSEQQPLIRDTRGDDDDDSGIGGDENDLEYFLSNNFIINKDNVNNFMSSADIHTEFVRLKNGKVSSVKIGISLSKIFGLKNVRKGTPQARGFIGISVLETESISP